MCVAGALPAPSVRSFDGGVIGAEQDPRPLCVDHFHDLTFRTKVQEDPPNRTSERDI